MRIAPFFLGLWLALAPAWAMSPAQVAVVTPAWQAPGWTGQTPDQFLGSDLKGWWNADSTSDGAVSTWTDGTSSIAVTAAAGLEAISGATVFNGKRGLTFDGTDDTFISTAFTALPTGSTAGEIWVSFRGGGVSGTRSLTRYGTGSATSRGVAVVVSTGAQVTDASTALNSGTTGVAHGYHVIGGAWSGTTEFGWFDGASFGSATIVTLATGTTRFRIGATNAATALSYFLGDIRHVWVTLFLTDPVRAKLGGWAAWDGNYQQRLPYNHPYRNRRP